MVPRVRSVGLLMLVLAAALSGCLSGDDDDVELGDDGTGTGGTGDDGDGNETGDGENVTDQAPQAVFSLIINGTNVFLDASASADPEGTTLSYSWDLGDNSSATGVTVDHTYAAAGNYTITLTVQDAGGLNATSAQNAVIAPTTFGDTATGTVAQPNPLIAFLPYASGETLDAYKQACAQEGTMCQTHSFDDVPLTATSVVIDLAGSGTGDLNLVVFDPSGAKIGASTAALSVKEKVTLEGEAAAHGGYFAFVYMPVGSNLAYTLSLTAQA